MADTTRQWNCAVGTGVLRVGIGTGLVALSGFGARMLGADRDDRVVPTVLAALGVRDVALGVIALAATRPGADVAKAIRLQAVFDGFDAAVGGSLLASGRIDRPQGVATVGVALASAAADWAVARHAARPAGLSLAG
jgi:hypothetical protein